ncbi:MAG: sigma-70 family RNA polymerase sigma factor [Ruminococcaceae bacterium]|nr:sigma-70 family RNA polymerase sigma factor [Oscillospiraceae bacterium]
MFNLLSAFLKFVSLILGLSDNHTFPPPLKANEERELFIKMKDGDENARARLIEHNMRLISHVIRKYYSSYSNPDELLSVGSLGLIKAVDSFHFEKGTRFATYGARCIQNEILMFFRSQKKTNMEVSLNDTIDVDRDGNPLTYLDIISMPETIAEDIDMNINIEKVRKLVDTLLDDRSREIIVLRYGLCGYQPKTQREVAAYLGISRSYVSRIEKRALGILKDGFGNTIPDFDD